MSKPIDGERSKWRLINQFWPKQQDQIGFVAGQQNKQTTDYNGDNNVFNNDQTLYEDDIDDEETTNNLIVRQELAENSAKHLNNNIDSLLDDNRIELPIDREKTANVGFKTTATKQTFSEQKPNKSKPINKSSKMEDIKTTNRLTMLEDPSELNPKLKLNSSSNNLPLSQLNGPDKNSLVQFQYKVNQQNSHSSSTLSNENDNLQQTNEQYLLFLPSILAILLLLALILHFAHKRRLKNGKSAVNRIKWLPKLIPSCFCLRKQQLRTSGRKRPSLDLDDKEMAEVAFLGPTANSARNSGCGGERIRLVDRRSIGSSNHHQQTMETLKKATIFEVNEEENENNNNLDEIVRLDSNDCKQENLEEERSQNRPSSKIVILQKCLAKNSLVVAAKSTKPKVRLITARVRKFIDEEANELRKDHSNENEPLKTRIFAYFFTILNGTKQPTSSASEPECELKEISSLNRKQTEDLQVSGENIEINIGDKLDDEEEGNEQKTVNNSIQQQTDDNSKLTIIGANNEQFSSQKLSPSPVLNEAYSSISACSLFSPSPIENQTSQICECSVINANNQLSLGINLISSKIGGELRSKSQNHSPCQLTQTILRPCCSVSPSALDSQLKPVSEGPTLNSYHRHQPPYSHSICHQQKALIDNKPNLVPTFGTFGGGELLTNPKGDLKSNNNHIKRQYENYYEDEKADAYRRLTASIGMDFDQQHQQIAGGSNLDNLFRFNCNQTHQVPFGGSYLNAQMIQTTNLAFQSGRIHLPQTTSIRPTCKCCCQSADLNQTHNLDELRLGQNSCPEQRTIDGHFCTSNQWNGGSTSELQSSTSTSLGGSDSGFISGYNGQTNVCQNPLCSCQRQIIFPASAAATATAAAQLSILVQQSSCTAAATDQIDSNQTSSTNYLADDSLGEQPKAQMENEAKPLISMESPGISLLDGIENVENIKSRGQLEEQVAQLKSCSHRIKWRNRRRINHRRGEVDSNSYQRRRLIQTSNQLTSTKRLDSSSITNDQTSSKSSLARETNNLNQLHSNLQHRASIASDGSWNRSSYQENTASSSYPLQNSNELGATQSQRPSDAALYEVGQFGEILNLKSSNYSSSGGSSSGIGFSGSACTNTPTSAFAYDNFLTSRQEPLNDFSPLAGNHHHNQLSNQAFQQQRVGGRIRTNPLTTERERFQHEQLCSCSSRKFSLPVQLESQAAERVSPNRSRLLFEKNLQRVDSTSLSQSGRTYPGEAVPISSCMSSLVSSPSARPNDSRRSSQTITRQSSFWLEDNSADSILSLTNSCQLEQQANDDCAFVDEILTFPSEVAAAGCGERKNSSQRPSIGSLMQSGDSIESVKQKPLSSQKPPEEEKLTSSGAKASTSTSTNDQVGESKATAGDSSGVRGTISSSGNQQQQAKSLRFSSSSTSSTNSTSSPSPDFNRPSNRLLALASRSSSITKRHLGGKLRSRRFSRLSAGSLEKGNQNTLCKTLHQNSAPSSSSASNNSYALKSRPLDESDEEEEEEVEEGEEFRGAGDRSIGRNCSSSSSCGETQTNRKSDANLDSEFKTDSSGARATSDPNSASLERQCRELWKLRATLHEDSCVADNWTNYHQRLNRRYDSGYKSIENQLSSSLENNMQVAAAAAVAAAAVAAVAQLPNSSNSDDQVEMQISPPTSELEEKSSVNRREISIESVESKLAEFELIDESTTLISSNEPNERSCDSRNSKSSEEDKTNKIFDTKQSQQ